MLERTAYTSEGSYLASRHSSYCVELAPGRNMDEKGERSVYRGIVCQLAGLCAVNSIRLIKTRAVDALCKPSER